MTPEFVFTVIFVLLIPCVLICTTCVIADTVLAIAKHFENKCYLCNVNKDAEVEANDSETEDNCEESDFEEL